MKHTFFTMDALTNKELEARTKYGMENVKGLTAIEVSRLQQQFGKNIFEQNHSSGFITAVLNIVREPMFLMLSVACASYFILGQRTEGMMMLAAMLFVTAISLYQEVRSTRALKSLKELTEPRFTVLRDGTRLLIPSGELVPGDVMLLEEGSKVPADAVLVKANDLSVNESVITGESLPVSKTAGPGSFIYQGTVINSGKCYARVTATGPNTELGKIGTSVSAVQQSKTNLQLQVNRLVKALAIFGFIGFAIIFLLSYIQTGHMIGSILLGLTLAMAAIPEEIPVAFSSFMVLGAHRLTKLGIITRQPQSVENLGAVSVICLDKTGTITENNMTVKEVFSFKNGVVAELGMDCKEHCLEVLYYARLASEEQPFDDMEKAIVTAYEKMGGV